MTIKQLKQYLNQFPEHMNNIPVYIFDKDSSVTMPITDVRSYNHGEKPSQLNPVVLDIDTKHSKK